MLENDNNLVACSGATGSTRNSITAQFISADTRQPIEVTEAQMQEAVDPRAKLVNLSKYEGKAILIRCQTNDGNFLWGSNVVSSAGPVLTNIVKKVFDLKKGN